MTDYRRIAKILSLKDSQPSPVFSIYIDMLYCESTAEVQQRAGDDNKYLVHTFQDDISDLYILEPQ